MNQSTRPETMARLLKSVSGSGAENVGGVLRAVRSHLGMDVGFVSEFVGGQRVFRHVDSSLANPPIQEGGSDPLETGYCQRVVDGRLPELMPDTAAVPAAMALPVTAALPVGAHLSVPIRLRDGSVYGTFCCFSFAPDRTLNERDLATLRAFAELAANWIDERRDTARRQIAEVKSATSQLEQHELEALGHLTGGIAHDFNNLLAIIMAHAELLHERASDPGLRETAELLMDTAERGASLTNRLLAFGRRQALRPEALELDQVIQSLSTSLGRTLAAGTILEVLSDACPAAYADKHLLEVAITNLVLNASEAMPNGGRIEIASSLAESSSVGGDVLPGRYARITVADNGPGMAPDVLSRALDPLFTTKGIRGGAGMGLPMVKGFARQSGGDVTIQSSPGAGTSVNVFLPLAPSPAAREPSPPSLATETLAPGRKTVLVVEDEQDLRRLVAQQLSHLGYTVLQADAGPRALEMLASDLSIDLLFTDLVLPGGLNGLALAERARLLDPELRILLTTGYADASEEKLAGIEERMIRKPYKKDMLAIAVQEALR